MTRADLDARAEELGINPSPRWKDQTVAEKIAEAEAALAAQGDGGDTPPGGGDAPDAAQGAENAALTRPQATLPEQPDPVVITVTGPKRGRWRAGRRFTAEPVQIPLEDLTEAEIAELIRDPKLTVSGLPQD